MKRFLAVWLLDIPPRVLLPEVDAAADSLTVLAQWCHRFAPATGIAESDVRDTLLLDITNLSPLYGGEQIIRQLVVQGLARIGVKGRAAIASTIGAAWGLAHFSHTSDSESPSCSGDEERRLAVLPIDALRLPAETLDTLRKLGVERIGDVQTLPREQLRSRFGPILLNRLDQALGKSPEAFVAVQSPPEFIVEHLLEFPLAGHQAIHDLVERLLDRLAWNLSAHCIGALCVSCRFQCEGADAVEFEAGWFQPTADRRHLLEIIEMEMERFRLPGPATAVSITAYRHAPLAERQGTLFESDRDLTTSQPLAMLVDRLAGRLGHEAVVRCRLRAESQPELAYTEESLVAGKQGRSSRRLRHALPPQGALDRPLEVLRRPEPLDVMASVPDGPLRWFRHKNCEHIVIASTGPERIETGWWRGRSAGRDYYRVETAEGRRFWLFRRRHDGHWFLHGMFG